MGIINWGVPGMTWAAAKREQWLPASFFAFLLPFPPSNLW